MAIALIRCDCLQLTEVIWSCCGRKTSSTYTIHTLSSYSTRFDGLFAFIVHSLHVCNLCNKILITAKAINEMLNYNYRTDVSFSQTMLIGKIKWRKCYMRRRNDKQRRENYDEIVSRSSHKYDIKANMVRSLSFCSLELPQWQAICCLHIMHPRPSNDKDNSDDRKICDKDNNNKIVLCTTDPHLYYVNTNAFPTKNCSFRINNKSHI